VKSSEAPDTKYRYDKIDEVPDSVIEDLVLSFLGSYGATGEDDLRQAVGRQLGFKRTGKNISSRIEMTIESLIRVRKLLRRDGDSLKLNGDPGTNYS
jgi:hypothetical protein